MNKFKPWLLLVLVFLAGVAVGVSATRVVIRRAAANPQFLRERLERELSHELKLSSEQRVTVRRALLQSQTQIAELRREMQPRFIAILENTRDEIASTLTPDQQRRFQQLIQERKQRWKLPLGEGPIKAPPPTNR